MRLYKPPSRKHPATFSTELLPVFNELLDKHTDGPLKLLDPMAGEGHVYRLDKFTDRLTIVASDIEEWQHADPRVTIADATDLPHHRDTFDVVLTSPPYGNRMADKLSTDGDCRNNYRDRLGRDTHANNTAGLQWGNQYRTLMGDIWVEAIRMTRPGGLIVMNCKDHLRGGIRQHVTDWHLDTLRALGAVLIDSVEVATPGVRGIANADLRTGFETIAVLEGMT